MSASGIPSKGKRLFRPWLTWLLLPVIALMVTGCPHNDYIIQLIPNGDTIERTLVFYCADGVNTNTGVPSYQTFPPDELAAITALYSAGSVTNEALRYTAHGQFSGKLPSDVGGVGAYTHFATTLGDAGFYTERFRGNNDFAGMAAQRLRAADRVTDLVVGWSQAQLGKEPGYDQLHQFLDVDFRRDLKNLADYWWDGQLVGGYKTNAPEEFIVRFGQYLWEHDYFQLEEIPTLFKAANDHDSQMLFARLQRLVARKMGVPDTSPVPASLAILADEPALEASFDDFLTNTAAYQAELKQWEENKNTKPDAPKPEPSAVMQDAFNGLMEFNLFGQNDHLSVHLSLAAPPVHSNGRWDETLKQVVWDTDLEDKTNTLHIPMACYASWAQPADAFQVKHFGKTAVTGDPLTQYCLWRKTLDAQHGAEWDKFLASLQPGSGPELRATVEAFRFADEPEVTVTNVVSPTLYPRELLNIALQ